MSTPMNAPTSPTAVDYDPFSTPNVARVVPTTEVQREVWLADRLGREASLAYNESVSLTFRGTFDTAAMVEAITALPARHDALRATISANGEELLIAEKLAIDVPITDLSNASKNEQELALSSAKQNVVEIPFNLELGPLLRAQILKLSNDLHILILTAHHAVCDGWSFNILVRDLAALYSTKIGFSNPALSPASSYADYAIAQRSLEGLNAAAADEAYWVGRFSGQVPMLDLPTDSTRTAWRTFTSSRADYVLSSELVSGLRKLSAQRGASLFSALLATFGGLLQRVTSNGDLVVGIAAAGQPAAGMDTLVGHCVNILPLRIAVDSAMQPGDLIAHTQSTMLDAYDHQQCTFGAVLKKLLIERNTSRLPLVSVIFNIDQALDANSVGFPPALEVDCVTNPRSFENFEIFINAVQTGGGLRLETQYNSDLFDRSTIVRWLSLFHVALERLVADKAASVADMFALPDGERHQIATWNSTACDYEARLRLGDLVARGMAINPDAIAVRFLGESVDYRQLSARAWAIAMELRRHGARPGTLVGVCLERSVDLVASLVGVVFSGAAYVPLDPTYPLDRLTRMGEDAAFPLIITRRGEMERVGKSFPTSANVVVLDSAALPAAAAAEQQLVGTETDPAYVIFTSGSTGRPKGAMNAHRGIVNRLLWMQQAYELNTSDRVVQKTPYSFDVSVWEFFWPLMMGATVVVAKPEGHRDSAYLVELIRGEAVTVMHFVPSMLRIFLDEQNVEACASIRRVVCSGEALPYDVVERFFSRVPQSRLANLYGPTEAAVDVTAWECEATHPAKIVPIGRPIANTQMHVLDEKLRQVPIGSFGDIYIGGVQVGMGYVSRPDLTAERFIADPFRAGGTLYKTGDVGRWRTDGSIEYSGRADHQVKIRGNRIELGEIEACLLTYVGINRSVVITREDRPGDVRLVAYFVASAAGTATDADLAKHLKTALPEYMIPQHFVQIDSIPLLSNGKVDRKALPAPLAQVRSNREFVAPRTDMETAVKAEMEASLGMQGISVDDDFFAMGGHSLLAMQLTSRLNRTYKTSLSLRSLFEAPTVAKLAQLIETTAGSGAEHQKKPVERLPDQSRAPLSVMQERLWFLEDFYPGRVVYHSPSAHRLVGSMNEVAFEQSFNEMVQRQSSLRTYFERDGSDVNQRVAETVSVSLFPAEDLSSMQSQEQDEHLHRRLDELVAATFDLSKAPLFRAHMFKLGPGEHVFFFMTHHIVWDGWSFDLLYEDISALYSAFANGRPSPLPPLPISYGDFSAWHRNWMNSAEFTKQVDFWRERMSAFGKPRELPSDKLRRPTMSGVGGSEWLHIEKDQAAKLHDIARQTGSTVFITLLSIYGILLYGFSRHDHLVIGTPVRGRNQVEFEKVMGFFNNLLPLQLQVSPDETFVDLVRRVKTAVVESFTYPDVPLEHLAGQLATSQGERASILYQALFSFQDARLRITSWGDLAHSRVPVFQKGATEDLGMWFVELPTGIEGVATYNMDVLFPATAKKLCEQFMNIFEQAIADPSIRVRDLLGPQHVGVTKVEVDAVARQAQYTAPQIDAAPSTETERILATIWCEQLKLQQVSRQDNFFDLGGHSLMAMHAVLAMEKKTGKTIDRGRFVFETLAQIANAYDEASITTSNQKTGGIRGLISSLIGGTKN